MQRIRFLTQFTNIFTYYPNIIMKKDCPLSVCFTFLFFFSFFTLSGCSNGAATTTANNEATQTQEQNDAILPESVNQPTQNRETNTTTVLTLINESLHLASVESSEMEPVFDPFGNTVEARVFPSVIALEGTKDASPRILFSPNGEKIATSFGNNITRIWNAETSEPLHRLEGNVYGAGGYRDTRYFFPNGKKMITGSRDEIRLWDVESGKELYNWKGDSWVISSDGNKVATVTQLPMKTTTGNRTLLWNGKILRIWDAESGEKLQELKLEMEGDYPRLSSDGNKIVYRTNTVVHDPRSRTNRMWDVRSGKEMKLEGQFNSFTPDGKKFLTVEGETCRFFDVESGKKLQEWKIEGQLYALPFFPAGTKITTYEKTGNQALYRIYDAESGEELKLEGLQELFPRFSQDGGKIITQSGERAPFTVRIYDAESREKLQEVTIGGGYERVCGFSSDYKRIVTYWPFGGVGTFTIYDAESGEKLREVKTEGSTFGMSFRTFAPDGKKIVMSDRGKTTIIYDTESEVTLKLEGSADLSDYRCFSPDGKKFVTVRGDYSESQTAYIWDVAALEQQIADMEGENKTIVRLSAEEERRETDRIAMREQREAQRIAAEQLQTKLVDAIDFKVELLNSGLEDASDFVQFGNAERKGSLLQLNLALLQGNALERAKAEQEISKLQAEVSQWQTEIAQKGFFGEYEYTYDDAETKIDLDANESHFRIPLPTGFFGLSENNSWIPVTDMFNLDIFLSEPVSEWKKLEKKMADWGFPCIIFDLPNRETFISRGLDAESATRSVGFEIRGSIKCFERFAQDKDNYRVRVWFTNLQHEFGIVTAEVLKIEIIEIP